MATTVITITLLVYSIILHEIAHGYSALLLGDSTAQRMGRLTLNPIPHIDPFMTILMPLGLYILSSGQFIFGGARPVPINPLAFRNPKRDMALTAAAGPLVNYTIALTAALALHLNFIAVDGSLNQAVFVKVAVLNAFLATFNLIPMLPLDGGRVLVGLLPKKLSVLFAATERLGFFGIIIVIMLFSYLGVFNHMIYYVIKVIAFLGGLPAGKVLLILIGET